MSCYMQLYKTRGSASTRTCAAFRRERDKKENKWCNTLRKAQSIGTEAGRAQRNRRALNRWKGNRNCGMQQLLFWTSRRSQDMMGM
jgi:hypothetical protein